jgi:RimJ/RimL family protein N-acetyltransferase
MTILETDRLRLRLFTREDADALFALDSDPEVTRYTGGPAADITPCRERIEKALLSYEAYQCELGYFVAEDKASAAFLGWFDLRPALEYRFAAEAGYGPGELDLGYRLHRFAWGKGLATEGSRALVRKAFEELGAPAIVSSALVTNLASTRVMEKCGLRRVSEFAMPGFDTPAVKYALTREEYDLLRETR